MLEYGIVGFGWAGKTHAKVINEKLSKKVRLTAVCDIDQSRLNEVSNQGVKTYLSLTKMLEQESLDGISICTPHFHHHQMCIKASRRKVPFLVEKPIATDYDSAVQIINESNKYGVNSSAVLQHRFELVNRLVKDAIDSEELGEMISTAVNVKWRKDDSYYDNWHGSLEECGGGVLITQAIHMIDIASWFNYGVESVIGEVRTQRPGIEVEDNAIALVKYRNKAFGVIDCSTSTSPMMGSNLEILGSNGSIKLKDGKILYWGTRSQDEIDEMNNNIGKIDSQTWGKNYFGYGHIFQIEDFINSIIEDRKPLIGLEEGLDTLKIVLSIYESSRRGYEVIL